MSDVVDKIKQKINIVDAIGSYVDLKKAGIHHKGLCPFHNEKTPSFTVSAERNSYYCFGCGAKGDIFSFMQEYEGITFKQALVLLADRAGVDITKETYTKGPRVDKNLYGVLELAMQYYAANLHLAGEATTYLEKRGLHTDTIEQWGIGYAKDEWRGVYDFLLEKGVSEKDIFDVGLIKKKENGGYYDVFRARIMFPIRDVLGRVVGFTGRILKADEHSPKYLNTPETQLFNKSQILYGLDKAKSVIRKLDYVILVEGQMDVVMSHQAGIKNAVASSGTAFTPEHITALSSITKRILCAFDADEAGIKAMKRAGWICLQNGFDVKVLGLSGMKDTADMVAEDPQIWVDAIKHSKPIVDFIINQVLDESIDQRRKIQKISTTLLPFIAIIQSSIEQAHYVKKVAELFSIPETAIYTELKAFTEKPQDSLKTLVPTETVTKKQISGREQREQSLVSLVFLQKNKPDIAPFNIKDAMVKIRGESSVEKLIEMYSGEMDSMLFQAEKLLADGSGEVVAKQLLRMYNLEYLDKQLYDIKQAIKASEQKEESIQSEELLIQYNNILALKKELLDKQ